jgi:predicted ATPase
MQDERLTRGTNFVFGGGGLTKQISFLRQLVEISPMRPENRSAGLQCLSALTNVQQLTPSVQILRDYSQTQSVQRMGERGENFAALVKSIIADKKAKSDYLSWLKRLTPVELDDITVLAGAVGEPLFAVKEKGVSYPARILSDGTLRFAAIAGAFFQPDMPDLLTIEEIENGIHPTRLRLLVELLKSQSGQKTQVIATTHSPSVVAWLDEEDYQYVFFCRRDPRSGASIITPLSKMPRFLELARKHSVADMIAEGWLESVR